MECIQFQLSLSRKSKGSVVFGLAAEWIAHWTVRGTSWTSAAVLTLHQWGAVHFSPHRSEVRWRGAVGGGRFKLPPYSFLTLSLTLVSYHTEALLNIPQQKWAFNITDTTNLLRNIEKWDLAACYEERLHSKYAPNGWRLSFLIPKMQFSNVVYFHYTLCFKWHLLTVST